MSVSADITIPASRQGAARLSIFALPVYIPPTNQISAPNDVHISQLASGANFTLLVLACPPNVNRVHFAIRDALPISETLDGKGKVEFDLSYSLLSEMEKSLIASSEVMASTVFHVVLPKRYDEADIATSSAVSKVDDRTFEIRVNDPLRPPAPHVWVSFPNPSQRALDYAKLSFSLLLGLFALAFQIQPLRDRRVQWFVFVFAISSLIVIGATYFYFHLARGLDFLVFSAAALPSSIYASVACIYLLVAQRRQAIIGGQVSVNGVPGVYVTVRLLRADKQGRFVVIDQKEALQQGGRYAFNVWAKQTNADYRVSANFNELEQCSTSVKVKAGKKVESTSNLHCCKAG